MRALAKCFFLVSSFGVGLICSLSAQHSSFIQDSIWMGEVYSNYRLGPKRQGNRPSVVDDWNYLVIEKYVRPNTTSDSSLPKVDNSSSFWSAVLLELFKYVKEK